MILYHFVMIYFLGNLVARRQQLLQLKMKNGCLEMHH